jgi:hypothetical protein
VSDGANWYVSNNLDYVRAIPDTSMLESPVLQFWAGGYDGVDGDSPVPFPEVLAGASNATATDDPTFRSDYQTTGNPAVVYDNGADGNNDRHDASPSQVPDNGGQITILATLYATDNTGLLTEFGADPAALELDAGSVSFQVDGRNSFTGGSVPSNQLTTCGLTFDDNTGDASLFDPVQETTNSTSVDLSTDSISMGFGTVFGKNPFGGGLGEIVICDTIEPLSNYDAYHTNRTS